jgi:type III secretory pathway component EscS
MISKEKKVINLYRMNKDVIDSLLLQLILFLVSVFIAVFIGVLIKMFFFC